MRVLGCGLTGLKQIPPLLAVLARRDDFGFCVMAGDENLENRGNSLSRSCCDRNAGSFDCVGLRFALANSAQDDRVEVAMERVEVRAVPPGLVNFRVLPGAEALGYSRGAPSG